MSDEPDTAVDPKVIALIAEAVARGIPKVGHEEPLDKPPVFTGAAAAAMREIARYVVDERMRERRVLSDTEIRGIAKEVAHTIFVEAIRPVEDGMRRFLDEKEIEELIIDKLKAAGIRADKEHIDDTRDTMQGVQKSYKRRSEISTDFVKELFKALAGWVVVGSGGALVTYLAMKGGSH